MTEPSKEIDAARKPDSAPLHEGERGDQTPTAEQLARDIIQYCLGNDILTQHGMKGLRDRIAIAIPSDVSLIYGAMLARAGELIAKAEPGTKEGRELDILVSAVQAYEDRHYPFPAPASHIPPDKARPRQFLEWAVEMFGPVAKLRSERLMRFVEEAIELAHADNMERPVLDAIANRVYSREPGLITKEIAQAQACLETYAENIGESSDALAETEWQRVQSIPRTEWQRRHKAKQEIGIAEPDVPAAPDTEGR